ncbi:MAG: response regulator [Deltaproteobacteria bacterium]|nr:response regulator [Deltaproteobacteria bacterium]MBW2415046.1 response regulator [Deltaproteobacteria bacterium]
MPEPLPRLGALCAEPLSQRRLLVVESDEVLRHSISVMLAAHFDFIVRRTGREALVCLDEEKPDLVLCDWELPDMNGLELVESVRRHCGVSIPTVVMSSDPAAQDLCWNAQVEAFILKPFNQAELLGLLEVVTRRSFGGPPRLHSAE